MADKRNIFLVGPMGAGKSTIGKAIAKLNHVDFYDSDEEIEKKTGADISWIFDIEGEEGFRKREIAMIDELSKKQGIVLSTGGGAIMSKEVRNFLSSRGIVVYLISSIDKQYERTLHDQRRPLLQNVEDRRKTLEELAEQRTPLYEEIADIKISTDDYNIKSVANTILNMIEDLT